MVLSNVIVFDWDGTLCDSVGLIVDCLQQAIADCGLPERSSEQAASIIGLGLAEAVQALYPDRPMDDCQPLVEAYRKVFVERSSEPPKLFSGVETMLERLSVQGFSLAVATGKSRRGLDRVLSQLSMSDFFAATRCADEAKSKPHPLMLEQIAENLGVSAPSLVMVGDTDFDIDMAKNAGASSVAVSYGAHPLARLQAARPDVLLNSVGELQEKLCLS